MNFHRKKRILAAGKSPSKEAMKHVDKLARNQGGVTVDFKENVDNLRETMRKLSYVDGNKFFSESKFSYVPSSYGEGKNFSQSNNRNLLKFSEEFDNGVWFKQDSTITPNLTTAPNGTLTADKLVETSANTQHNLLELGISFIENKTYTASLYVKALERNKCYLRISDGITYIAQANFDLITNTYTLAGTMLNIKAE